jgi:hypothetical protein
MNCTKIRLFMGVLSQQISRILSRVNSQSRYRPGELSVRYWVGVILQVFLNTRQKYAVSL